MIIYKILLVLFSSVFIRFSDTVTYHSDSIVTKKSHSLTNANWTNVLTDEWLIEFKAPWCPACQSFEQTWERVANVMEDYDVKLADIDVTVNPSLSGRFFITSLPTIYHAKDGVFRQYEGSREEQSLIEFVSEKRWQDIEPTSWLLNPTSPQMAVTGYIFQLSMFVRDLYETMANDYGIPEWVCYVIFAIITIITGIGLGLVLVLICDCVFPSRPRALSSLKQVPVTNIPEDTGVPNTQEGETDRGDDEASESHPVAGDGDVPTSVRRRAPNAADSSN